MNTHNQMTHTPEISAILADCEVWAKQAAETARTHFRQTQDVEFKDDESPVTAIDRLIEAELKAAIAQKYPADTLFGEESGIDGDQTGAQWVIDPIDGTRSFLSGHPLFGMLLAHVRGGVSVAGVVSMPALDEVYTGGVGHAAKLNGVPTRCSGQRKIDDCILYINEGEKLLADHPATTARLLRAGRVRRFGYDCYPHMLLASGHVDAVVDYDLKPYDFLALSAVIEAAGGIITDWKGQSLNLQSDGCIIAAATDELHRELVDLVQRDT